MSAASVLAELARADVILYLDGDDLRARARPGALTEAIRGTIAAHRPEIVQELAAIAETVANVRARPSAIQDTWRRLVPPGVCFDCGGPAPRDGRHWCATCEVEATAESRGRS